jgi:rhodanese-related sulfurtransferase
LAYLAPAGEIPCIGKAGALIWFHRVNPAVFTLEEHATPVGFLVQSQTIPLRPKTSETLDKFVFGTLQKARDVQDLVIRNAHHSWPAAAVRTALALIPDLHRILLFRVGSVTVLSVNATHTIDPEISMSELLQRFPGAQRALFRSYHIGGCSSCGFRPDETLAQVCQRNGGLPVAEVTETILASHEAEQKMQISPEDLSRRLQDPNPPVIVDVRSREEWDAVHLEDSQFLTQELMQEIMTTWPKDREVVVLCHHGVRSMDAASYFAGHGFSSVKSLSGGIDAWSVQVDSSLPRYHVE